MSLSQTTISRAVEAARPIHGWMSENELGWLAEEASTRDEIVEVGVWQGRTTKALATATNGRVWAVDNLSGQDGLLADPQLFERNLDSEIQQGIVKPVWKRSAEAALDFDRGSVDMVFIDACHTYPAPLFDIWAWRTRLKPDGLLCGHDADFEGVDRALEELLPNGWMMSGAGSIWVAV